MSLDQWLSALYGARVGIPRGKSESEFVTALQADPALLAAARDRSASLDSAVAEKCFLSRTHRDILAASLRAVETTGS
jgi:hypothetical protein